MAEALKRNLFEDVPIGAADEVFEEILAHGDVRIERIVSNGQRSPNGFWYDQAENEWVILLSGRAGLQIDGDDDVVVLAPGDSVNLPAHRKHRVAWTAEDGPTVWLAVFY